MRQAAHHGQNQQSQHVIDHGRRQDDLARYGGSNPLAASTCAVIPTLVATMDAPTKMASWAVAPQQQDRPAQDKRHDHARTSHQRGRAPDLYELRRFTSRPTRNSRNMAPRSDSALRNSFGPIQPSTLGPMRTPARISPTIPG